MKILTGSSTAQNHQDAMFEIAAKVKEEIGMPDLVFAYYTQSHDEADIQSELQQEFPDAQIIGCSSCCGSITEKGVLEGHHLSVWATKDPFGAYGVAGVSFCQNKSIQNQAKDVLRRAMEKSGREGELPALIVLHATPGNEESILEAIYDELGVHVPILGGTAADDTVSGNWSLFDNDVITSNGMALAVMFPCARVSGSFHSGYVPTEKSAIATRVDGRTLLELDGEPAAQVYFKWYKEITGEDMDASALHTNSTLYPFGRHSGKNNPPHYRVSHLAGVSEKGGLNMFSTVLEGERVHLMVGEKDMLISRGGIESIEHEDDTNGTPIGGMSIFCAGRMLYVKDDLTQVAQNMATSMQGAPFVCPFTFGEQGQFREGEMAHGNLMISTVMFYKD